MIAVSAALIAAGADPAVLSMPDEAREKFDAALVAAPVPESASAVLARRLGVA